MSRVIVVGAGVSGLTCAVRLLERGHRVNVVARDLPLKTTSAIAGAFWYPYRALPKDRVTAWGGASYAETRTEEHTSELQSLMRISYAVFCLKKISKITTNNQKARYCN